LPSYFPSYPTPEIPVALLGALVHAIKGLTPAGVHPFKDRLRRLLALGNTFIDVPQRDLHRRVEIGLQHLRLPAHDQAKD